MGSQGREDRKVRRAKHVPGVWDEESFFAEMERKHDAEYREIARTLYDWAEENLSEIRWGKGQAGRDATFYGALRKTAIFGVETRDEGFLFLRLENIMKFVPFRDGEKRDELLGRVRAVAKVQIPARHDFLGIPLRTFKNSETLGEFCQLLAWINTEIQRTS